MQAVSRRHMRRRFTSYNIDWSTHNTFERLSEDTMPDRDDSTSEPTSSANGATDEEPMPLRVLVVEDSQEDTELLMRELRRGGYEPTYYRVETPEDMREALASQRWDIVISDYSMPVFSGLDALALFKNEGPDIPFIIVSGTIGEETTVEAMRAGAHDYVMKDNPKRLLPAIDRELREAMNRMELRWGEERLKAAEESYRQFVENFKGIAFQQGRDAVSVFIHGTIEEITGYTPEELASGNPSWDMIVHPDDRSIALAAQATGQGTEGDSSEREYRIIRKDGRVVWVQMIRWTIYDSTGRPAGVQGVIYDVTGWKAVAEELLSLKAKLAEKESPGGGQSD
jgi:PAS domain S-box-containing protein